MQGVQMHVLYCLGALLERSKKRYKAHSVYLLAHLGYLLAQQGYPLAQQGYQTAHFCKGLMTKTTKIYLNRTLLTRLIIRNKVLAA